MIRKPYLWDVVNVLLFEGRQTQAHALVHWLRLQLASDDRVRSQASERIRLIDAQLTQNEGDKPVT